MDLLSFGDLARDGLRVVVIDPCAVLSEGRGVNLHWITLVDTILQPLE